MTGAEYLYCYCQLREHGFTHEETIEIIEKIETELTREGGESET